MTSFFSKLNFFSVCAIVVFATMAYGTVHQPIIALFYFLVCIAVISLGASLFFSDSVKITFNWLQLPLILLAAYSLVQIIPFGIYREGGLTGVPNTISIEPFATWLVFLHLLFLGLYFFTALNSLDSVLRIRRLAVVLTAFGFLYAFYAILQSVLSPNEIYGIYKPEAGSPFGSFVNKHNFAAIIEMLIAIPLGLLFCGSLRTDKKLLYLVAVFLMGAALLLSGSRGGFVAFVFEIAFLVLITSHAKGFRNIALKIGLGLTLLITAIGGAVFVGGDTSLTRFAETASSDDISSSRFHIWSVTIRVINEYLPFGTGLGAFPQAYSQFDTLGGYERVEQAHNDYLQIAADAGVPGILIGILFLFLFVKLGRRALAVPGKFARGAAAGAMAGCSAILVHSLFDFVLHITAVSVMFLMLLTILAASTKQYRDDSHDDHGSSRSRPSGSVTSIKPSRLN